MARLTYSVLPFLSQLRLVELVLSWLGGCTITESKRKRLHLMLPLPLRELLPFIPLLDTLMDRQKMPQHWHHKAIMKLPPDHLAVVIPIQKGYSARMHRAHLLAMPIGPK